MSKYFLLCLLITTLGIVNCEKEISYPAAPIHFPGSQEFGEATADKNGAIFTASGVAEKHNDQPDEFFGISLYTYTDLGALRESVSIFEMEYSTGYREIVSQDSNYENGIPIGSYFTFSDDGDVLEDSYKLDERQSNWIDITAIDTTGGEQTIFGKFSLHFKMSRENTNPLNPEHVRFTEGQFMVRFE